MSFMDFADRLCHNPLNNHIAAFLVQAVAMLFPTDPPPEEEGGSDDEGAADAEGKLQESGLCSAALDGEAGDGEGGTKAGGEGEKEGAPLKSAPPVIFSSQVTRLTVDEAIRLFLHSVGEAPQVCESLKDGLFETLPVRDRVLVLRLVVNALLQSDAIKGLIDDAASKMVDVLTNIFREERQKKKAAKVAALAQVQPAGAAAKEPPPAAAPAETSPALSRQELRELEKKVCS
jgi:hypothetical protein